MTYGRSAIDAAPALAADDKTVISGDVFVADVLALVERLKGGAAARPRPWRAVVGVVRGGVFPARRVSEALGLAYREIRVSYYVGTERTAEPQILDGLADPQAGEGLLVVDDVVDSGGTALCVRRVLPRCDLAAVYTKPAGLRRLEAMQGAVEFYGRRMDDKWIVFPWDQPGWDAQQTRLVAAFREKIAAAALPIDPDQGAAAPLP